MVKICYNLFTTMSFKQFRPGFQQESILLHRGNVENSVENVEKLIFIRKAKNVKSYKMSWKKITITKYWGEF